MSALAPTLQSFFTDRLVEQGAEHGGRVRKNAGGVLPPAAIWALGGSCDARST